MNMPPTDKYDEALRLARSVMDGSIPNDAGTYWLALLEVSSALLASRSADSLTIAQRLRAKGFADVGQGAPASSARLTIPDEDRLNVMSIISWLRGDARGHLPDPKRGAAALSLETLLACAANSATSAQLRHALEESVKLQSHYAGLLNMHDGGERMTFDADSWIARLESLARSEGSGA